MTTEPTPPTMILCRRSGAFIGVVLCAALQTGLGCQQSSQQETVQSATTEAAGAKEPNVAATPAPPPYQFDRSRLGLFSPLPNVMESPNNTITEAKTKLGRMLFTMSASARIMTSPATAATTCSATTVPRTKPCRWATKSGWGAAMPLACTTPPATSCNSGMAVRPR